MTFDLLSILGSLVLIGVAGFFVFLRYLDYVVHRDQKINLAKLASLACPMCGTAFGEQTAEAAKSAGERRISEMMAEAQNRGVRLRVVMIRLVTCSRCGSRFNFWPAKGELLLQ